MKRQSKESMMGFGATKHEAEKAAEMWDLLLPALKLAESDYPVSYPIVNLNNDWDTRSPLGLYRILRDRIFTEVK